MSGLQDAKFIQTFPFLLALILIGSTGCDDTPAREVRGTVTLDGKPLESGEIVFKATEGSTGPTTGALIENGEYYIPAVVQGVQAGNTYRVEITSMVGSGRMSPDPNAPTGKSELLENIIPEEYNMKSELRATISSEGGVQEHNFQLKR